MFEKALALAVKQGLIVRIVNPLTGEVRYHKAK